MDEYDALFLSSRGVKKEQDLSHAARGKFSRQQCTRGGQSQIKGMNK